jgi:hypothetical protein
LELSGCPLLASLLLVQKRSRRTEKAYLHWITRFIYFSGKRHFAEMGAAGRRSGVLLEVSYH